MRRWGVVLLVLTVLIPNVNAIKLDTVCHEYYEMIQVPGLTYEDVGRIAEAMYHGQCWPAMQGLYSTTTPTTAPATSAAPPTRVERMDAFVPDFWRTMPAVSSLCRTIVTELLYIVAGRLSDEKWEVGSYHNVVQAAKKELIVETTSTHPEVISFRDWLECREVSLWGIDNRQTPQEQAALREIEAHNAELKAAALRSHEERQARQQRQMEEFKQIIQNSGAELRRERARCEAAGGTWLRRNKCHISKVSE